MSALCLYPMSGICLFNLLRGGSSCPLNHKNIESDNRREIYRYIYFQYMLDAPRGILAPFATFGAAFLYLQQKDCRAIFLGKQYRNL